MVTATMTQQIDIHHEITGEGTPLVVLHGLFGDADNFRSIALQLERYYQVIRLDLPGHGRSTTLPQLSFQEMAIAVQSHLATMGLSNISLIGHSLGGKVAMQMAGNPKGEVINKLIVVDIAPRLYPPHHERILDALSAVPLGEIKKRADAQKWLQPKISDAGVLGFLLKSLYRNEQQEYAWRFDLDRIKSDYDLMRQPPTFSQVVQCPSLFLKGGDSDYLGPQDEIPIRTHFNDPHFKEITGTGHWPHAEKPALFTRLCLEFLGR